MKFFVKIKKVVLAAIAFSMILSSTCVTSHAATVHRQNEHDTHIANTNTTLDNGIMPLGTNSYTMGATNTFTSINVSFGAAGGVFAVSVPGFLPGQYRMDIMMWGSNGLLWQQEDCLGYSIGRGFQCGRDVRRISLRIVPRSTASPRNFTVNVSW